MIRRVAITGPESTGKSMLAESLARIYHTEWVPEYAREYLGTLGRPYEEQDIVKIARRQLASEDDMAVHANRYLFCDTELLVTQIWSLVKYNRCDPWITRNLEKPRYDLYLLCDIDLPWQYDPLREHPDLREHLFTMYRKELERRRLPFAVVSGQGALRLNNALGIIGQFFMDYPAGK